MRKSLPSTCLLLACGTLVSPTLLAERIAEEVVATANRLEKPLSTIPTPVTVINQAALQQQLAINNDPAAVLGNLVPSLSPSRQKMTNAGEGLRGRKRLY